MHCKVRDERFQHVPRDTLLVHAEQISISSLTQGFFLSHGTGSTIGQSSVSLGGMVCGAWMSTCPPTRFASDLFFVCRLSLYLGLSGPFTSTECLDCLI